MFLELKRRGFDVCIGRFDPKEIGFVATKPNSKCYIQVAAYLHSPKTIEREFSVLESIDDNYPKYVVTMDTFFGGDRKGVKWLNIIDFLMKTEWWRG